MSPRTLIGMASALVAALAAPAALAQASAQPLASNGWPMPPKVTPAPQPTPAVREKLAEGDRAFVAGDFKTALFAYEDATYAQPAYLGSRIKTGRTYLSLRYPAFASFEAEVVLASDPSNPEASALLDEARRTQPRAGAAPAGESTRPPQRVLKLSAGSAAVAGGGVPGGTSGPAPAASSSAAPAAAAAAPAAVAAASAPAPEPSGPTAAQHYRAGLDLMGKRDWNAAANEFSEAIALDPRLAVAYSARASARFGLQKYREAADDYKAALGLDPGLATPLYGLAECYRLLGDPAAAEYYKRYADSTAKDVRDDLRAVASQRAQELSGK
ncbi:MAG TPA: tetratricopeptide repeat protein [Anaeromyxobacteraceae bacterium]|nr:tetratricopeptide repeat protein [Anaeromyxobacteraceae bacterium]